MTATKSVALAVTVMLALPVIALVAAVSLIASSESQCTPTMAPAGAPGGGGFEETAYGPPWVGEEGDGMTAYGIDLTAGQPMLEIAIDPSVLTPRAYYHVWPNPLDTHGAFIAGDTGADITGEHIDTYDWQGRSSQVAWGTRYGVDVTPAATPGAGAATGEIQAPASPPTPIQRACAPLAGVSVPPGVYVNPFHWSASIAPSRIGRASCRERVCWIV